jgi:chromosome segregation ATPase
MAKDEIIAKLMADLAQANADKEDLQAQITQEEEDNVILHNTIDDQDVEIVGLTSNDTRNRKQITDLLYDRRVCYNNIDDQAYEIGELKAEVSRQNRRLDDQERKIEELEAERNIYEEEEEEDINQDNDISSTTGNNGSDNSSAAGIKSEGEAMDHN